MNPQKAMYKFNNNNNNKNNNNDNYNNNNNGTHCIVSWGYIVVEQNNPHN